MREEHWEWEDYIRGFRSGADHLASFHEETHKDYDLVYPTMYLYRHYLELRLKQLVLAFQDLIEIPTAFPGHHRLAEIWEDVRELEKRAIDEGYWDSEENFDKYPDVGELIDTFDQIDQNSFEFRYPVSKKGTPTLVGLKNELGQINPDLPPQLDLGYVRDVFKEVCDALDGAVDMVDYCKGIKYEMMRDAI